VDPDSTEAKEYSAKVSGMINDYLTQYPELLDGELNGANNALNEAREKQLSAEIEYATSARSSKELDQMYE
jgi:hypothetical protein